ncbi:MAG TPA: hypothetical protein VJX67_14750 [Blastocatellia bacterium]|nr:hypothetical protein [Blastocatellia bacterium]
MDWVTQEVFGFKVEIKEIRRPDGQDYLPTLATGVGVLHTTEIPSVEETWHLLNDKYSPPHFITGESRIIQCRPLGAQGAALRTNAPHAPNAEAQVQIEQVAFSRRSPWLPDLPTLRPTVALMAYCSTTLGIPLRAPNNWPDNWSSVPEPWDADNQRRQLAAAGLWPTEKGWWTHMEVPWQEPTWHWDCGAIKRSEMLAMAAALLVT